MKTTFFFIGVVLAIVFALTFRMSELAIPMLNGDDRTFMNGIGLLSIIGLTWFICALVIARSLK